MLSGELKSVYVRNLPSDVSVLDVEQLFNMFGKLKPDGVVIRSREVPLCTIMFLLLSIILKTEYSHVLIYILYIYRMLVFVMHLLNLKTLRGLKML